MVRKAYLAFASAMFLIVLLSTNSFADNEVVKQKRWNPAKPWIEPQDTSTALNSPDLYAWQLFVALNWPADPLTCRPDRTAKLGDSGFTTWETWRSREETFLEGAQEPKNWNRACNDAQFETLPVGQYSTVEDEEVRMNRKQYNYIRDNKLYSLDEQERLVAAGVRDLEFPLGSKSVKAYWVEISEADKPRYHWHETVRNGQTVIYGLSALHINSKDNPTWFWSTFEHVDNEDLWPNIHPNAFLTWVIPSVDSVACPKDNLSCNQIPAGFGLEGTKWENYRLRGSQIDWADNRGEPTILTNSVIEYPFDQKSMSCVTCHAIAVKGTSGPSMPILPFRLEFNEQGRPFGYVGTIEPDLFKDVNGQPIPYLGLDYVWTLKNAKREAL